MPRRSRPISRRSALQAAVTLALLPSVLPLPGTPVLNAQGALLRPGPVSLGGALPPPVSARAAAVLDGASGAFLFDRSARQPLPPASLTKIVTAMVALERADPRRRVVVSVSRAELDPEGTMMGLMPGETLTVEDLLYGMMLPSGNDAALELARVVAGNEATFINMMNATVWGYGLRGTHFVNPHGLHAPDHYTTAHDIAQLARFAMRDERFCRMVRAETWTVHGQRTYTVRNRNPLIPGYAGADGVKIGWTEEAGATIVASASRNGHRVIVALLDTRDRVADSGALLDWVFANFRWPDDGPVTAVLSGA